VQGFIYI